LILVYLDLLKVDAFAAVVFFTAIVTALIAGISFHEFSHALPRIPWATPRRAAEDA